ncbi:MAG: energy coupling factor transporter S component ThiW [Promethearchaeota archaeon]
MQDVILNILFCCLLLLLGGLIIGIRSKMEIQGFDYRILLGAFVCLHGIFILLSMFEFSLYEQKMRFLFTLGLANAVLIGISLMILLKDKYLINSFISGTYFIMEVAFVTISSSSKDLHLLTLILILIPSVLLTVVALISYYKGKTDRLYFQIALGIIGATGIVIAYGVRSVLIDIGHYWAVLVIVLLAASCIFLSLIVKTMKGIRGKNLAVKVAMTSIFTALGVVLSFFNPLGYINLGGFLINPFAHLINALTGVILGPFWAVISATFIAIIRFSAGIGSIYAFPGGIPGAMVVGIVAAIFSVLKKDKLRIYAAFFEVIGTVGIGAVISYAFMGAQSTIFLWGGFAMSSILGSSIGFLILWILEKRNINYVNFGETLIV